MKKKESFQKAFEEHCAARENQDGLDQQHFELLISLSMLSLEIFQLKVCGMALTGSW